MTVEIFLFLAYLIVLFQIIGDLFRDSGTSGLVKAIWVFFLIMVPLFTALLYLIVRGHRMAERSVAASRAHAVHVQDDAVPTTGLTPVERIEHAKDLLDASVISRGEFDALKARALSQ